MTEYIIVNCITSVYSHTSNIHLNVHAQHCLVILHPFCAYYPGLVTCRKSCTKDLGCPEQGKPRWYRNFWSSSGCSCWLSWMFFWLVHHSLGSTFVLKLSSGLNMFPDSCSEFLEVLNQLSSGVLIYLTFTLRKGTIYRGCASSFVRIT